MYALIVLLILIIGLNLWVYWWASTLHPSQAISLKETIREDSQNWQP